MQRNVKDHKKQLTNSMSTSHSLIPHINPMPILQMGYGHPVTIHPSLRAVKVSYCGNQLSHQVDWNWSNSRNSGDWHEEVHMEEHHDPAWALKVHHFDNERQFDTQKLTDFLEEYKIEAHFSTISYPQTNGQVKAANKQILSSLRKTYDNLKGLWVKKLLEFFILLGPKSRE